jgi:hypothetical protein
MYPKTREPIVNSTKNEKYWPQGNPLVVTPKPQIISRKRVVNDPCSPKAIFGPAFTPGKESISLILIFPARRLWRRAGKNRGLAVPFTRAKAQA